jgi:hypothetical protein
MAGGEEFSLILQIFSILGRLFVPVCSELKKDRPCGSFQPIGEKKI